MKKSVLSFTLAFILAGLLMLYAVYLATSLDGNDLFCIEKDKITLFGVHFSLLESRAASALVAFAREYAMLCKKTQELFVDNFLFEGSKNTAVFALDATAEVFYYFDKLAKSAVKADDLFCPS